MKKRALGLLAACALLISAVPAFAAVTDGNDWLGKWVFTYANDVTDTVTLTDVCVAPDCPQGAYWDYIVKGTKSDSSAIQIRRISFDAANTYYYELTDDELTACGQKCAKATIPDTTADCNSFTVSATKDPITLVSGKRSGLPRVCTSATPDNCTATKVLGADNPKLEQLRDFRDSTLAKTTLGRKIIAIYYSKSASVNAALDRSPALQAVTRKVFEAAALLKK